MPREATTLGALRTAVALAFAAALYAQRPPAPPAPRESGPTAAAVAEDPVVVRVGAMAITRGDVEAEANRLMPMTFYHARVDATKLAALREQARQSLVEKALVQQDAVARGIEVGEAEVAAEFEQALRKAGQVTADAAERQRLLERYRPLVVRRLLIDRNEARFVAGLPPVDEVQLREAYRARAAELVSPAGAHLRHILVKVAPTATDAEVRRRQARIEAARAEIAGGRAFADVAREVSEDVFAAVGGDLGVVRAGSMQNREVERAAFALRPGEMSAVLSSIQGFHLVQCLAVEPGVPLTFDEARPMLQQRLADERRTAARREWLAALAERFPVVEVPAGAGGAPK